MKDEDEIKKELKLLEGIKANHANSAFSTLTPDAVSKLNTRIQMLEWVLCD